MFLQKIVLALMALLVFAIPIASGRYTFNINLGEIGLMSIVGMLASVFAVAHLLFGHRGLAQAKVPMDPSVTLFGVFVALNFASVGWAHAPGLALDSSINYLQLLIFVWLLLFLRSEPRAFSILLHAFFAGSLLMLVIALYDILSVGLGALEGQRFDGLDMDENDLALKLVLGIVVAFYLFRRGPLALRWFYLGYIPSAAFLSVLTGSRTGFVLLVFALTIGLWSILKVKDQGRERWATQRILMLLAFVAVVAIAAVPLASDQFRYQTERIATVTKDESFGGRTHLWRMGFAAYLDNPILGVGSGGSSYVLPDYAGHDGLIVSLGQSGRPVHNTFLGIVVETGTVGALLFLIVLGLLALRITSFARPERVLLLSLMGVALISGMTLSLEQSRDFYFALFLCVALAASRSHNGRFFGIGLTRSAGLQDCEGGSDRSTRAIRAGTIRHQS